MIDLREISEKQKKLKPEEKKVIDQFMKDIEAHINKIAPIWPTLSAKRKDELLAHSPILAWVVSIAERVR